MELPLRSLPALALALFAALRLGRRAQGVGVPRVTAYLVVGALLGPYGLGRLVGEDSGLGVLLLRGESEGLLHVLEQLGLGFILYRVGSEFRFAELRRTGPRILAVSAAEVGVTAVLLFGVVYLFTGSAALALIAPALGISSAPSATLLTLREVEAEGSASRSLIQLVGLNNLVTLLAFPLLLVAAFGVGEPLQAIREAGFALAGGGLLGILGALSLESLTQGRERVVLGISLIVACLGYASLFHRDPTGSSMLACFGAGVALTNASPYADRMGEALEGAVYPLYVFFFLAAGAELHLDSLAHLGLLGAAFIAARTAGKVLGTRLGVRLTRWGEVSPWLGNGLLCQAGVALGLVSALEQLVPERTAGLRSIALGSVVFFEFLGPYMTRRTAIKAGEVKLANLVLVEGPRGRRALGEVAGELGRNLGVRDYGGIEASGGLTVRHVLRRAPEVARTNLTFDKVLKLLGELGSDLLPVVDEEDRLQGVISFSDFKDILYDPHLRSLMIAEDLAQPVGEPMTAELPLQDALARMDAMGVHSWPVVEDGKLLGMIKRKDCYATLHKAFSRTDAG